MSQSYSGRPPLDLGVGPASNRQELQSILPAQQQNNDTIDLGTLARIFWRGKWFIALVTVLSIMGSGYYVYFAATPLYQAKAVVMLVTQKSQVIDFESVIGGLSGDASELNSEVQVMQSRTLLRKVVQRLGLTTDPEFNEDLRAPSHLRVKKRQLKDLARSIFGSDALAEKAQDEIDPDIRTLEKTINALLSKMSVRNIPLSVIFEVIVETENAKKSARIADTLVDLYILNQLEVKFEATQQATEWLSQRVAELQDELEQTETRVKEFSASIDLVSTESLSALELRLKEMRKRVLDTRTELDQAMAQLALLTGAETREAKAELSNDTQLQDFLSRVSRPGIAEAFDARFEQIIARAKLQVERTKTQVDALVTSQAAFEGQLEKQGKDLIELQQLKREAEANRLLYEYFLSRLKETSAQQGVQQADSRVLSYSVIPERPTSPRKSMLLGVSGMLGLMLGMGLVVLKEARNSTFRMARELENHTGYTVLGQIPLFPARRRKDTITYLANRPTSAAAEAIRNLRTSILLSNIDSPPQIIMTTSSIPGEGKTTFSLALAQSFVGLGKKVLVIEGDIRRRVFSHYLDNNETGEGEGLLSVLSGKRELHESVLHDSQIGADILTAGKASANAADLFASDKFRLVLDEARKHYDQIIIDTPPVLVVPDARLVARHVDALVFLVRWDSTHRHQVEEALRMFESVNQRITGLVLNQISPKGMKSYGYGGKYGAYSGYGRKYYVN